MRHNKFLCVIFSFVATIFLYGCISDDKSEHDQLKIEEAENKIIDEMDLTGSTKASKDPAINSAGTAEADIVKASEYSEKEVEDNKFYVPDKIEEKELPATKPFYKDMIRDDSEEKIPITVTFDSAPIASVARSFSNMLKFDYIIDPQVAGNISISVNNSKMSKIEVWEMFEHILWLSGAYISPEGEVLHILPFAKMPQEKKILVDHKPQPNVEVMMFPIKNAASKDILDKLKNFLTPGSTAIDIPYQNSILLIETPANSQKIRSLVELLDKKNKANWPQEVIRCVNVSSARIKNELLAVLPILGFPVSADNVQSEPGSIQITSLDRLQVILATAANAEALKELKRWVAILDKSDVGEQEQVFIYKVVNGNADELLGAVSMMFPTEGSTLTVSSSGSSGGSSDSSTSTSSGKSGIGGESSSVSGSAQPAKTSTKAVKSPGASSSSSDKDGGPASVFDVPVKVFADAVHNRLVVKTTPRTYSMLRAILERLDTVAAQVLLQVMVSEVTLTKDTEFGVEFSTKVTRGPYQGLFGSNFRDMNPGAVNEYGMKYWVFNKSDPDNKFAYLKALAGDGKIKVLSCPQVVVK
ncbi:MAG TPA: hypothetical protein PK821_06585, partial [Victivallales bacterium]|nr:hypothetical protein [Victivallales bacterium]